MDHSAIAHALEVKADGQLMIFSGDFRDHGRKATTFKNFLATVSPGPEALLIEGTTLSRKSEVEPLSESELENKLLALSNQIPGTVCVQTSAENIDQLVGLYRACKRSQRTLVVDL